jgi:hypothetical protein
MHQDLGTSLREKSLILGKKKMIETKKQLDAIVDYATGKALVNIGAEENRQAVERFLIRSKGYRKTDIDIDVDMEIRIADEIYTTRVDLVVVVSGLRFALFKCAAGSLGSREREAVAAARLLDSYQIPIAVVSDGKDAFVLDTVTGKKTGEGLDAIPSREAAIAYLRSVTLLPFPRKRREKEKLIFRSYDVLNVNVGHRLSPS